MAVWEYKIISSGKGGFATPALMETFLNQLGKEEWEIIHFHTPPDNPLAFQGLARRSTQRDWTLEDAAAAAARAEAEKLRSEFEAKFRGAGAAAGASEEGAETLAQQKAESDDGLRRLRDTDRDQDPGADEEESAAPADADDWDKLAKEEELPTFFEAIQPLMRRNQRGAGMSVGIDHLAKKWGMSEEDIMGVLKECGFAIPEDEDDKPEYLEYDGDLFWVNVNRRGEYWVNTKEKPRAIFKAVKGQSFAPEKPAEGDETAAAESTSPEAKTPASESPEGQSAAEPVRERERERNRGREDRGREDRGRDDRGRDDRKRGLPEGTALLDRIRPQLRRERGGQGFSGSVGFLSRALKCKETEMVEAFAALGLTLPGDAGAPAGEIKFADHVWSLSKDQRGGVWIHGRRGGSSAVPVSPGEEIAGGAAFAATDALTSHGSELSPAADPAASPASPPAGVPESSAEWSSEAPAMPAAEVAELKEEVASQAAVDLVAILRPSLKETRTGALAAEVGALAAAAGKSPEELLNTLVGLGLRIPEKAREKAATIEVSGETLSLTRNAKEEIWLNVKPAGASRPKRSRRGPAADDAGDAGADPGETAPQAAPDESAPAQ